VLKYNGKTDYGGITGSLILGIWMPGTELNNGVMVEVGAARSTPVRPGEITDGASHTIVIAECTDRRRELGGRWISGFNCLSQDNGGINETPANDIFSRHAGGAYVAFADGRIEFVSKSTSPFVVGAICTRGGGETIDLY